MTELLTKSNQTVNIGCNPDTRNNQEVVWIHKGEDGFWHGHTKSDSSLTRYPLCKKNLNDSAEAWELDDPHDLIWTE